MVDEQNGNDQPAGQSVMLEAERVRRQRSRSLAIAVSLFLLVVLFYVATLVKMSGDVAEKAGAQ